VLEALRRRIVLVLLCVILVPLAAVGLSLTQEKEYTATAALLFRNPGFDREIVGNGVLLPSTDPDREAATNLRLVSLDTVDRLVAARLGVSADDVRDKIDVQAQGNSDIVTVSATDEDPRAAADLANLFAEEYIIFRQTADREKILQAANLVRDRLRALGTGPEADERRSRLEGRLEQLQTLASLQTGNAEVVETADVPTSASSPQIARNAALGALLGVVLGVALALILDRVDRRIREPDELQEIFDLPVLGYVPESANLRRQNADRPWLVGREAEAFRMLRTSLLYFNVDRDIRSILVTSSAPSEGKTTVSWNLACAAAAGGADVLLIEADMRHPTLRKYVGDAAAGRAGLGEMLAGDLNVDAGVIRVPMEPRKDGSEPKALDVILSGPVPPNPAELLESNRMRLLLEAAERTYDLVVIDTPPISILPDAVPLVKQVSGVAVVSRVGMTTRDGARQLRGQLENLRAPTLGLVVNNVERWRERYSYGYAHDSPASANGWGRAGEARRRLSLRRRSGRRVTSPASEPAPEEEKDSPESGADSHESSAKP
jgi:capsular exopolysaccharide synthesis family protein